MLFLTYLNKKYMKKITILFILIIIILCLGLAYLYIRNNPQTLNLIKIPSAQNILVEDKKIEDNTKPFTISIIYPQINGLDEFNKEIKDAVDKELSQFKTISLDNDNAVKEFNPEGYEKFPREYDLFISYAKGQVDQNIVSVVLYIEGYTGGAHPYHYSTSFNYDVKNKRNITLSDLFPNQKDYLQKISEYCINELTNKMSKSGAIEMSNTDWIQRGAGPDEENYSVFLINPDNTITFYFGEYQVAAYAAGDFKVTYPR